MHDPLNVPDPRAESRTPSPETRPIVEPDSADREIPLAPMPSAVHAFLDGEHVAQSALSGAEKELKLWEAIGAEAGRRARMKTPAHVQKAILEKLTDD